MQTSGPGGFGGTGVHRPSVGLAAATCEAAPSRLASAADDAPDATSVHVAGTTTSPIRRVLPATPEKTTAETSRWARSDSVDVVALASPIPVSIGATCR